MRELHQVQPAPTSREDILEFGLREVASMAPGVHGQDPAYSARRAIKDYVRRILAAADNESDG